jgi:hypothetical protein
MNSWNLLLIFWYNQIVNSFVSPYEPPLDRVNRAREEKRRRARNRPK